jgi:dTDP-4-dehydrorhamnose 3,5-epimerase
MKFEKLKVKGAYCISLEKHEDHRGFFSRLWCKDEFKNQGIAFEPVQVNFSRSLKRGTIRGMHYQVDPFAEAKLVCCVKGSVYDAMIDLRPNSQTYLQWDAAELKKENFQLLFIPAGCAHGYQVMSDNSELIYFVSQYYQPQAERGIRWDDRRFNINWPIPEGTVLSEKDNSWPEYDEGRH